jgi:hypothetical protein
MKETRMFKFYNNQEGKLSENSYRLCRNFDELISKLNEDLYHKKDGLFKNDLNVLLKRYLSHNFSNEELTDIISLLIEEHWNVCHPSPDSTEKIFFPNLLFDFFLETVLSRGYKKMYDLVIITMNELKENKYAIRINF